MKKEKKKENERDERYRKRKIQRERKLLEIRKLRRRQIYNDERDCDR
jgi:hypothetical protein